MKQTFVTILILALVLSPQVCLANTASSISLQSTGYDWLEYTPDEKQVLMIGIFTLLELDLQYDIDKAIFYLNTHYEKAEKLARDDPEFANVNYLDAPCLWIIGLMLDDYESEGGVKAIKYNYVTE